VLALYRPVRQLARQSSPRRRVQCLDHARSLR
jgi:hypothetical protein